MAVDPPQNEAEFDKFAAVYDAELNKSLSLTGESKEYFANGRMRWIQGKFERLGFAPETALDFGCGKGGSTPYFFDVLGVDSLTGVDPSEESLALARTDFPDHAVDFCLPARFAAKGSLDLAFSNGVFHHVPIQDRADAVRLVFEALRPGGLFALWENNAWNPVTRFIMSNNPFDRHAILLFPHGARQLLREGGFKILATDYLFIFPNKLAFLRPLERWVSKLPLGGQYLVLARKPA